MDPEPAFQLNPDLCLYVSCVIFALLDPYPDPGTPIESESNPDPDMDPDAQHWYAGTCMSAAR